MNASFICHIHIKNIRREVYVADLTWWWWWCRWWTDFTFVQIQKTYDTPVCWHTRL